MNEELRNKLIATKEGQSIIEKNLQERFKKSTATIVMEYNLIKETDPKAADRMLSYVFTGIVTMCTKDVDESLHLLNKTTNDSKELINHIDKFINVE